MTVAGITSHAAIYSGILLHHGSEPISVAGWVSLTPEASGWSDDDISAELRDYSVDMLIDYRPDTDPTALRFVEFSWTDLGPVAVPDVDPDPDWQGKEDPA